MQIFKDLSSNGRLNRATIDSACPAISEEIRAFAAYIGSHINGKVDPLTCVLHIAVCRHDVEVGTSSFLGDDGKLPKEVSDNRAAILRHADRVLYVIDGVAADDGFADDVHRIAAEQLGWHATHKTLPIPPRGITDAARWWGNLLPPDQANIFKEAIEKHFRQFAIHPQHCTVISPADPDGIMKEAIDEANDILDSLGRRHLELPQSAKMIIQANRIQATPDGCPHHSETVWTAIAR